MGPGPSASAAKVSQMTEDQARDEKHYGEIDVVLLYLENTRRRAERAAAELRSCRSTRRT